MLTNIDPAAIKKLRVNLAYKNFAIQKGISHIGLGVAAMNNSMVLRRLGIRSEVRALSSNINLRQMLNLAKSEGDPYTHVVISAPWIPTRFLQQCAQLFPETQIAVNCHSNVAFLSVDSNGTALMRDGIALQTESHNFQVAGNSKRFCKWMRRAYMAPCTYLPNMYYLNGTENPHRPLWRYGGGVLKVGIFGATRVQKNIPGSVAAAIQIAQELKTPTEIWVNAKREDGPASLLNTVRQMVLNVPNVTLNYADWQPWPGFRGVVGAMHVLMQNSWTESFNMVSADGVATGVPSCVSDAIDWVPEEWQARVDNTEAIARTTMALIHDSGAAAEGLIALKRHNREGLDSWLDFLLGGTGNLISVGLDA